MRFHRKGKHYGFVFYTVVIGIPIRKSTKEFFRYFTIYFVIERCMKIFQKPMKRGDIIERGFIQRSKTILIVCEDNR